MYDKETLKKLEIIYCLDELKRSWNNCLCLFQSADIDFDINDYIAEFYPFDEAFEDIDINNWIEESIKKLEKESKITLDIKDFI